MKTIKQSLLFIMLTATQIASRGLSIEAYNHPITKKKNSQNTSQGPCEASINGELSWFTA